MAKKQVTFADIAEYTHFSKTTISRYFNHPDSLTLENQEKISQALEDLGYKKNKLAKVLANGKSEFIGIIVPNLYLHYYSEMLTQLLSSYRDYHYKFLVFVSDNGPDEEEQYIEELMSYQIEGLIVLSHTLSSEKLASYQIPVIAIEREAEHICSVTTDNYMGALQAASLLIRDHCDVLIHINADVSKIIPAYNRIRAFEDICKEHHVPYELNLNVCGDSYQELFSQMKIIFADIDEKYPGQKKGVFLANDTYANMFLNLIFQKYGCLPDTYELVGFDNSPIASEAILPITTIGQQIDVIAHTSMELLVHQMRRLDVLPGITGLAQCSGRNNLSIKERINIDIYYVKHVSFKMDVMIVLKTVKCIVKREGFSNSKSAIHDEIKALYKQNNPKRKEYYKFNYKDMKKKKEVTPDTMPNLNLAEELDDSLLVGSGA